MYITFLQYPDNTQCIKKTLQIFDIAGYRNNIFSIIPYIIAGNNSANERKYLND